MSSPARGTAPRLDQKALFAPLQEDLKRVDAAYHRALASDSPHVRKLVEHAALFRGKQLRPALVLLAGRAAGRETDDHVIVGAIVEMIHTATLLHDDVLDHATTRRNTPSVNALHGNEVPILLGDFIYAQAFALANTLDDRTAAIHLAQTTRRLCTGEIDQNCNRGRFDLSFPEYLRIIEDKTASLYAASARLGAWYAGATAEHVTALEEYGRLLGIAFQIIDDCLDLAGDERSVGKSLGTDLSERKMTLPLLRLLDRVPAATAARVRQMLADGAVGDPRAALGAIVDFAPDVLSAQATAEQFVREARARAQGLPQSPSRQTLLDIADFVLERDR
ncbi:MAG: polyprenyl synthetase family protein [Planctomycetes bacterium]|nr:polyprenyl synthetase family protein [Planctomycetota bacterium]